MSDAGDSDDDFSNEPERQFILRLPPHEAEVLKHILVTGEDLEERLSIEFEEDLRHATITFDNKPMPAKLCDLPTIIESCKTVDDAVFYKTADICQILTTEEDKPKKKEDTVAETKKYVYPDGITPPLKNVRKKRHRRALKPKNLHMSDIEKEIESLINADLGAYSVRYELVDADAENAESKVEGEEEEFNGDEYDIFGDYVSCSSDSLDDEGDEGEGSHSSENSLDEEEIDVDIENVGDAENNTELNEKMKKLNENEEKLRTRPKPHQDIVNLAFSMELTPDLQTELARQHYEDSDRMAASQLVSEMASEDLSRILDEQREEKRKDLWKKRNELRFVLADLKSRRRTHELEISYIDNDGVQEKMQASLEQLKQQEYEVQKEYDEINSAL
ncbi:transcription initiation factor TFIID subunit 7 [Caerostris darwini]|uniref:Transcription initiation factor TFIID subunit 7 n=1 Tax=Caerostris darwini TaxID=1538125 RepID=A0AAV4RX43_9ARAC|nr:transcription initiation factor TFIID subunit 7 [Caerostris darwini]